MKSDAILELAWAVLLVVVLYVLASSTRRSFAIGLLIVLIPFQFIETRFATSSVLLAYALAAFLILSGGFKLRMLPELAFIVVAYVASAALAGPELRTWHAIATLQFISGLVVFLLAYNFARLVENERAVVSILLATNLLVLGYCALQLSVGPGNKFVPFGIEAFAFNNNRDASDPRLIGPFSTPGAMAGYFTLLLVMCVAELIHAQGRRKRLIQVIIGLNVLGLMATGNRAGMLVLLAVFPALMFVFRRELGPRRIVQFSVGGVAVLMIAFAVAVSFTNFGNMLTRMENVTETENGVPETRAGTWPVAVEKIKRHPWFGEGPYFLTIEQAENMDIFRHEFDESGAVTTAYDAYPHSLYLYLLRTVGTFGLFAMLWFFVQAWRQLYRATQSVPPDRYSSAILRGGIVAIPAFLVAQITLEFNRYATLDYAHFVFALVGLLVGMSDRALGAVAATPSIKSAESRYSTRLAA